MAARTLGIKLQAREVRAADALAGALSAVGSGRTLALFVLDDPMFLGQRAEIVAFAAEHRLPTIFGLMPTD